MTDEPARTADPMTDVFAQISGVKIKDGDTYAVEFKVTVPLNKEDSLGDLLHIVRARRGGGAHITLRLVQQPLPEDPMDGEIPPEPFPAWEKLFDAAEMPMCECPDEEDPAVEAYPRSAWVTSDESIAFSVSHMDPCKLPDVTISTLDFNTTEDFNRAIVKARGLKAIPLPEEDGE